MISLFVLLLPSFCRAQQDFLLQHVPVDSANEEPLQEPATDDLYNAVYLKGVTFFEKGLFTKAELCFKKAFKINPSEEVARYLYYTLLNEGNDLEAGAFKSDNKNFTFAIAAQKGGLESIYVNVGPRFSGNTNAGNIYYADNGVTFRLSPRIRLWRSLTYLRQNENLGHFKQFEYSSSFEVYLKNGWSIKPSVHYAYVPYTYIYSDKDSFKSLLDLTHSTKEQLLYETKGLRTTTYTLPGRNHFINASFLVNKHLGAFTIGAEPSFQYWSGKNDGTYSYLETGTTDSFRRERFAGTKSYQGSGSGTSDTSFDTYISSLQLAVSYQLPLKNNPVFLRAAAFYLLDKEGNAALAWQLYGLIKMNQNTWLHLNYTYKGNLPLASNWDGIYYNYTNIIKSHAGLSLQLFPLKQFSPWITYQYEQSSRSQDDARLVYHSIYLTLKYHL